VKPTAGGPLPNAPTDRTLTDPVSVDCICPTFDRHDHHGALYQSFARQTHQPKTLWVLDNSQKPSPFFSTLIDPRVHYVHQPGRVPHGAARNELLRMSSGQVVAHLDDDDRYGKDYLARQLAHLRSSDADLVKLSTWDEVFPDGRRSRLDGRKLHENDLWGWGFSYVYRRHVTSRVSFQSTDGTCGYSEDIVFLRALQAAGLKTQLVDDGADSVLHLQRYECYFTAT
jgi:glycosyltransferase involved in cell wall biosynthesis